MHINGQYVVFNVKALLLIVLPCARTHTADINGGFVLAFKETEFNMAYRQTFSDRPT
jgi:hypothetical protein